MPTSISKRIKQPQYVKHSLFNASNPSNHTRFFCLDNVPWNFDKLLHKLIESIVCRTIGSMSFHNIRWLYDINFFSFSLLCGTACLHHWWWYVILYCQKLHYRVIHHSKITSDLASYSVFHSWYCHCISQPSSWIIRKKMNNRKSIDCRPDYLEPLKYPQTIYNEFHYDEPNLVTLIDVVH